MEAVLRRLIDPAHAGPVLAVLLVAYYGGSALVNEEFAREPEQWLVAELAVVSAVALLAGWGFGTGVVRFGRLPTGSAASLLLGCALASFAVFVAFTTLTAPSVPLLSALLGNDPADIALAREEFLKARGGALAVLPYLNAALTFTLVPYAMCLGFLRRKKTAWLLLALFLGHSVLFIEKAFFVRVLAPLAALVVVGRFERIRLSWLVLAGLALLILNVVLSGFADERGVMGFLVFRLLDIPARTAIDTLVYWRDNWGGEFLGGATNLVFSELLSLERIHLERLVFEYQFGPYESGTASANSVFFVDAYVNFGYPGVVLTAALVGAVLAYMGRSADLALRCLVPLIVYSVFFASFFSVLFGNGLLAFLIVRQLWVPRGPGRRVPDGAVPLAKQVE